MHPPKAAFITGGARRVGKSVALYLAKQGYDIALHYNTSESEANETAAAIRKLGVRCELYSCDLARTDLIEALMTEVWSKFPGCQVLINNASIFQARRFMDTDEAFFDQHMAINFKAPFFLTQQFAKHCKHKEHAAVINFLDTYITKHSSSYFTYLASKKALAEWTVMAARDIAPIRVNGICPGIVLPSSDLLDQEYIARKKDVLPLKHTPALEEITKAVGAILDSRAMTGQFLFIDSGEHLL